MSRGELVGWVAAAEFGLPLSIFGAYGMAHAIRLLRASEPVVPEEPQTRLGQLVSAHLRRVRSWGLVFSAAVVGAAVSDYDHQRNGLAQMLSLFLFVLAGIAIFAGISFARAGYEASRQLVRHPHFDGFDLAMSCVLGGLGVALCLVLIGAWLG